MSTIVYYGLYLDLPSIALSLALRGYVKGFKSLVESEEVDVHAIEVFRSHSQFHNQDNLFLLYEVVRASNEELLAYLIETCGLSLSVRANWIQEQSAIADRILQSESGDSPAGCAFLRKMIANPYRAETLIQFAQQVVADRIDQIASAESTISLLRVKDEELGSVSLPFSVDEEELERYRIGMIETAINSSIFGTPANQKIQQQRPDFDAELLWRTHQKQKLAAENLLKESTVALESARACLAYVLSR